MVSLEAGRESMAKLLGLIHPPDKVCASRPSGSGCAGLLCGSFGRQSAVEKNTGLQFRRYSLEIPALNQVLSTDIQLILSICAIEPVMFFSCDGDYTFVRHKEMRVV